MPRKPKPKPKPKSGPRRRALRRKHFSRSPSTHEISSSQSLTIAPSESFNHQFPVSSARDEPPGTRPLLEPFIYVPVPSPPSNKSKRQRFRDTQKLATDIQSDQCYRIIRRIFTPWGPEDAKNLWVAILAPLYCDLPNAIKIMTYLIWKLRRETARWSE